MKIAPLVTILIVSLLCSCGDSTQPDTASPSPEKNEVIVLGTIHSGHLKQEEYSIKVLSDLIEKINPDLILTEIPPDRFQTAINEYTNTDSVSEPRVKRFPEYVDVIFPLTKTMDFEIIPTAAWTREMADERSQILTTIENDTSRADEWNEMIKAGQLSDSLIKASGREYDPYWINSDEYDRLVEIELEAYNRLFNDEIGLGGWDNINIAHYSYIEAALDDHKYQGKRVLITYGAGHKGWFLRALKKREDIKIVTLQELVPLHQ